MLDKAAEDVVNHPSHYETGKYECIDVMEEVFGREAVESFCVCNAFKYLYRHKRKNRLEDLKKARWYLDRVIESKEEHGDTAVADTLDQVLDDYNALKVEYEVLKTKASATDGMTDTRY